MPEKSLSELKLLSDEQLIREFQNDNMSAFDEIVRRYKDRLVNFIYRYSGSREFAEDAVQETFIKLIKNKQLYKPVAKFTTWIHTIAINEAKTMRRKENKPQTFSVNNFFEDGTVDYELESSSGTPDIVTNTNIELKLVQEAINRLDEKYREAVILRDIQDFEYEEISKILGIPMGTVRSRINRGRESLKITLGKLMKEKKI